jgi:hypothetical protein
MMSFNTMPRDPEEGTRPSILLTTIIIIIINRAVYLYLWERLE